ncbi:GTP 3',8-cyclase MoaA [Thermogladius sp. 4427co]|uniref:GTP 3',8-cyclase MoaA n=1 Tax=Thermogladius sp. 4427co TaxID=3450718 RepID=UPI003F78C6B5
MLVDRFGRPLTSLRISVTEKCNYRCVFCHREGLIDYKAEQELSPEDWGFVAKVSKYLEISDAKLTGGEPLVRRDIVEIVREIRSNGLSVSITTNGSLLEKYAKGLAEAGVDHINVSLHSLREEVFRRITGGDLGRVLKGIDAALSYGIRLKIDFVVLSWNKDELMDIIEFASRKGIDVNLIELIPLGLDNGLYKELHVGVERLEALLKSRVLKVEIREFQSRPIYYLDNGVRVQVVKGFCNPELCAKCSRIRFTPDGKIKTCLFRNDNLVDARPYILNRDFNGLVEAFKKANSLREPYFKPGRGYPHVNG